MKHLLTITEIPDTATEGTSLPSTERLRLMLDECTPQMLQDLLSVLYKTPRKPRSDRGKRRGEKTAETQQRGLPGT